MGVAAAPRAREQLIHYLELLAKWGRVHNLSAVLDPPSMVSVHLLDSLTVAPYITGNSVLDIGTGAGLPGVPLAITMPELSVHLLESRKKRTRFLYHVVGALGLENVEIIRSRVEQYQPPRKFDTLVTRAFSTIAAYTDLAGHLCACGGRLVAMKGRRPTSELEEVDRDRFDLVAVHAVEVPGLDAERHVVILTPSRK
jgi:16S rRNA (guanine527-N7)-methyltransferase